MGNKSTAEKVFEVVDKVKSSEPLTDMPLFMLLPPYTNMHTEALSPAYGHEDLIKMPSLAKFGGPEGIRVKFYKRLYDPNKDPQLFGDREKQDFVIDALKKSVNFGIMFKVYEPSLDQVPATRGELEELEELRKERDEAQANKKESRPGG